MVIDDLDDVHEVRAGDGLGEFVVIDEDELALDRLEQIGLRQNARDAAVIIHDGERGELRLRGHALDGGEIFVLVKREEFFVQHVVHRDCRAHEHCGRRRVVRALNQADFIALGFGEHLRLDRHPARHDEHAHAGEDGAQLDVAAVADDDDEFLRRIVHEPFAKRFLAHRADHQDQILLLLRLDAEEHRAAQRARQPPHR